MSLIELLVVVTILLVAAAVFVPRLQPLMDHSKVREAARVVQLYLSTARNTAMATGRSCGVMIEPLVSEPGCSMMLSQVETPPLFGGDFAGSTLLTLSGTANGVSFPTIVTSQSSSYLIAPVKFDNWPSVPLYQGDQIQIGYQGYWYGVAPANSSGLPGVTNNITLNAFSNSVAQRTTLNTANGSVQCLFMYLDVSHGENPLISISGLTEPYKIRRWPTKSATKALQLPSATVIDLTASGYDPPTMPPASAPASSNTSSTTWMTPQPGNPPTIMFAPDGTVDRTYVQQPSPTGTGLVYQAATPTTPVYLLIGLRNKVNPPVAANANINDFNSLWISIDPATGLILVSDPGGIPAIATAPPVPLDYWKSRTFARQSLANGGGK